MKREYLVAGAAIAMTTVALAAVAPKVLLGAGVLAACGACLYRFGRCHHGDRLGLLPPTTNADGTRSQARWYCDQCGQSWPANFERDRTPVVRFSGYDPSKLPAAARRAAALDKQRQSLALRRAGQLTPRVGPREVARVTSISERRAAR